MYKNIQSFCIRLRLIRWMTLMGCMVSLLVLFVSCSSDRQEIFTVENEVEFILPTGLNTIETHVFVIRNVPTFLTQNLAIHGMRIEDVASIGSARGLLTGSFQQVDYDFIEDISVRVRSVSNPNNNREMFFNDRIPFTHDGDLELLSSISELKEIMINEVIDLEVRIRLRGFIPIEIQSKLIFSYAVFDEE